jgi:nucleotide-binding universal stress UspA family protein
MTIENQSRTEKRTICIAVDESENSEFTVSWAIENIVQPESDTVVLLNARPSLAEFQPYVGPTPDYDALMKRIDADHIKKSTKLLNKLGLWFKAQNIETRGISLSGDPKAEILKKTTELNPSLLMVGSRGMGPIATGLLGSVSNYLVHHSKLPVFVVGKKLIYFSLLIKLGLP